MKNNNKTKAPQIKEKLGKRSLGKICTHNNFYQKITPSTILQTPEMAQIKIKKTKSTKNKKSSKNSNGKAGKSSHTQRTFGWCRCNSGGSNKGEGIPRYT